MRCSRRTCPCSSRSTDTARSRRAPAAPRRDRHPLPLQRRSAPETVDDGPRARPADLPALGPMRWEARPSSYRVTLNPGTDRRAESREDRHPHPRDAATSSSSRPPAAAASAIRSTGSRRAFSPTSTPVSSASSRPRTDYGVVIRNGAVDEASDGRVAREAAAIRIPARRRRPPNGGRTRSLERRGRDRADRAPEAVPEPAPSDRSHTHPSGCRRAWPGAHRPRVGGLRDESCTRRRARLAPPARA